MAKHRKQTSTQRLAARAAVTVLPMAAVVTGAAVTQAAPPQFIAPQPGVTTPPNPGTQAPAPGDSPTRQPGVTTANTPPPMSYVAPEDDLRGIAPETDYLPARQIPQREYVAPLRPEALHAPEPEPAVAPIVVEPVTIRIGDMVTAAPDFLAADQVDQFNAVFARPEADISQFARSVGVAPSRADSVASAAIAGAVGGAALGCGVVGGIALATVIGAPLAPIGCVSWGVLGGITGAAIGAGIGGLR
ncbi:hypothetical protein [Nocardia sp. NPDC050406]|uniref:hypothetical protein n=1 Tax=Nocardia sp. NPDC050406 TaxID=3364318 RepID=UPI0037B66E38